MENINIFTALAKTFQINGRSTRKEYWLFALATFIVFFVVGFYEGYHDPYGEKGLYVGDLLYIALLPTFICVNARRLHDISKSGWWQLILFVPLAGFILWIIWWTRDGTIGPNLYGPDPKGRDSI